jgi:hypothetical protein
MTVIARAASACTIRGLAVGALGSLLVGGGFQYSSMVLGVSALTGWHYTIGANIMLFAMALLVNPLLGLIRRSWMMTPAELAQVYVMWTVGSAVSVPVVAYFLPQITSMVYYASPENNWAMTVLPQIPAWVIPLHDFEVVKDFYEGRGDGAVPWDLWLPALFNWVPLLMSLYVAMIAIVVILRKQWIDHERLVYPMMQLPIAMIQDDENGLPALIKPLFKNWIFWLGFALPFIIYMNNGLVRYLPLDYINPGGSYYYFYGETVRIRMGISFFLIGFAYFIRRDVTLGLCFFFVLYLCYEFAITLMGGGQYDPMISPWSKRGPTTFVFQGFGAFAALIGVGLWNARHHLKRVARSAFGLVEGDEAEAGEIMSYRAAVFAAIGSLCIMSFWLWRVGMPFWVAPLYLLFAFILFLGITRVVSEGGVPWFTPPMIASDAVAVGFGTRAMTPSGLVALGFTYCWGADMIILVMSTAANGLKVVEETVRDRRRLLFWSMIIALVVSLGSSIYIKLDVAYEHGGLNTSHTFKEQGFYQWEDAAMRLGTLTDPNWGYWGHAGLGATVMGLLMVARQRFLWWPFHPLAFPISVSTHKMFISILVAWALKSAAVGYGGPRLYRKLRPFFLGLIMGEWAPKGIFALYEFARQSM